MTADQSIPGTEGPRVHWLAMGAAWAKDAASRELARLDLPENAAEKAARLAEYDRVFNGSK